MSNWEWRLSSAFLESRNVKFDILRLRREDVPEMARRFANLELTTYLGAVGGAYSLEDEQAYFESVSKSSPDQVTFGIYLREGGDYIGGVDLRGIGHRHGTAELGVSIHNPDYWGGGYGSEGVRLMVEYGMFFLGLHNIVLNVFAYNTRGIRAYEKVGFREVGRRRGAIRLGPSASIPSSWTSPQTKWTPRGCGVWCGCWTSQRAAEGSVQRRLRNVPSATL